MSESQIVAASIDQLLKNAALVVVYVAPVIAAIVLVGLRVAANRRERLSEMNR